MRVSSRVVLIACSASVIGAPAAAACSPQDYMSPEEWQALSPEQRAENTSHTHDAVDPAASPAAPVPADPPVTREAAPQVTAPAGGEESPPGRLAAPPVPEAAPVIPALDGRSHRRAAAERPKTTGAPRTDQAPAAAAAPLHDVTTKAAAGASARTTVVAVEQLTRMAGGSRSSERASAQRAQRNTDERAAARRASARQRRSAAREAAERRTDARLSGRTPVRAGEVPHTAARADDTSHLNALTAITAVLAALTALAALLIRRFRFQPPAAAASGAALPPAPSAPSVIADPVEAELQAMIAAHAATPVARQRPAQEAETGDESSTATNSA